MRDLRDLERRFRAAVNMTPQQILAWHQDPRAKRYSLPATRARLPALARMRARPATSWSPAERALARRVVSFVARFDGMRRRHGCTPGIVTALRNWGHQPRACPVPR